MSNKDYVTYEEFGAKGDGVTDDFAAIYAAHEYANANNLPIVIDDGRTYYIHDTVIDGEARSAEIRTDVNWGSSEFIIDDTDIDYYDGTKRAVRYIFEIKSDYEKETVTDSEILSRLAGIGEGTKKIDLALGYPALVVPYDENHRVFIRTGRNGKQFSPQKEIILIDGEGNVDPSTPFMFDYGVVTALDIIRTDVKPITVRGGKFTTRACRVNALIDAETKKKAGYYARGIFINRSYTTLIGIEHYVTGEITTYEDRDKGLKGPHYRGFYVASEATDVLIKDCILTSRRYYGSGTYEFSGDRVNRIYLEGCTQSNFTITDEDGNTVYSMTKSKVSGRVHCWGIGGTNFCKNMEYLRCKLSRFDAHQGLYNGKIVDSTVNMMELTGKGELLFENLNWCSANPGETYNSLAYLRNDYGSTWEGTITFKNCTANVSSGDFYIFEHGYRNWDFGYQCHFPNLILDNLTVNGLEGGAKIHIVTNNRCVKLEPNLHLPTTLYVPAMNSDGTADEGNMTNNNPIAPPNFIKVINNNSGYDFYIAKTPFFENTEKVGVVEEEI